MFIHSVNSASQGSSSEVSGRGKKMSTTSFGSGVGGGDYLSTTLERRTSKDEYLSTTLERRLSKDKSEAFGMCFKRTFKRSIYFCAYYVRR